MIVPQRIASRGVDGAVSACGVMRSIVRGQARRGAHGDFFARFSRGIAFMVWTPRGVQMMVEV